MKPLGLFFLSLIAALWLTLSAAAEMPITPERCLAYPYTAAATPTQSRLRDLMQSLDLSLKGVPAMRAALVSNRPVICIDTRAILPRGYLDTGEMYIALKSTLSFDEQHLILIHELRHLEQFSRGHCPSTTLAMQENARAVMATEADAMAITALLAWDLKSIGQPGPWAALTGWDAYSDIAQTFEAALESGVGLDAAASAAFAQWYRSPWRVDSYYRASCSDYLDRLDDSKQLPSYDLLPADFLTRLCRLPGGETYPCSDNNRPE